MPARPQPQPEDPDAERLPAAEGAERTSERPPHLRPGFVLLVGAGGAVGTALRQGLSLVFPGHGHALATVLVVNVLGAIALGALLEGLARRGADRGARRVVRLGAGTGVLGGFTTYSTLAVGSWQAGASNPLAVLGYPLLTLLLGIVGSTAGVALARWTVRPATASEERA